jgi:hypothetical protein
MNTMTLHFIRIYSTNEKTHNSISRRGYYPIVAAVITNIGEEYILEPNSEVSQSLSIIQEEIRNSGSNKKTQVNNMTK